MTPLASRNRRQRRTPRLLSRSKSGHAEASKPGSSLRGGIAWSLASFAGTKVLTFASMLVLARLVAPAEFGILAAVLAFITLLELMSDLGMKATVIFESEKGYSDRVHTTFTLNLVATALMTVLAVASAPLIARLFQAEAETALFALAATDVAIRGLGNIHDALLLRDMRFRRRIITNLTANLVRGGTTIALAVAGLGAPALVIGFIAGTAAWTITLWLVEPYRPRLVIRRDALRGLAAYGGWASGAGLPRGGCAARRRGRGRQRARPEGARAIHRCAAGPGARHRQRHVEPVHRRVPGARTAPNAG
jgi:O-antigen/teichoic acid export membrane protein